MKTDAEFYFTIAQESKAEYKDRGSRFLAFAFPVQDVEECKKQVATLKKIHTKAVHHCFAYKLGLDGNNFRANDDGEPAGSAGKPILGQINSKQLTNVLVVVVRYFGGTLLGVPGLINAYKTATSLVLQTTPIIQKPIEIIKDFQFDYTKMNEVMIIVKKYNCTVLKQDAQLFCLLTVAIPKSSLEAVQFKINEIINR
ncbi:MAG: YigZ family protein [Chitinophagaceae bacterium]|nr:YigZ family protein [Chitinophagaceae bacterium]